MTLVNDHDLSKSKRLTLRRIRQVASLRYNFHRDM